MRLVIGNSVSNISGLTPSQFAKLRRILSCPIDQAAAVFGGRARYADRQYLLTKRGSSRRASCTW